MAKKEMTKAEQAAREQRAAEARRRPRRARTGEKTDRIAFRVHGDLRRVVDDLARRDRRTTSAWVELHLIDYIRDAWGAPLDDDGALDDPAWVLPDKPRRR